MHSWRRATVPVSETSLLTEGVRECFNLCCVCSPQWKRSKIRYQNSRLCSPTTATYTWSTQGSFLCTDWDIFSNLEIDEATEVITDYIHFCADNLVTKNNITVYPNNKPYITKSVKDCINRKKLAFKNNDRVGLKMLQRELNQRLRKASQGHLSQPRLQGCAKIARQHELATSNGHLLAPET